MSDDFDTLTDELRDLYAEKYALERDLEGMEARRIAALCHVRGSSRSLRRGKALSRDFATKKARMEQRLGEIASALRKNSY